MRKMLTFMLTFSILSIPLTVRADVFPSTWTGFVYVEGDGAGGVVDTVPSGLAPIDGLELSLGAVLNQAVDLTVEALSENSAYIGTDSTLSTYNVIDGTFTIDYTDLVVGYGSNALGQINQTGGTVYSKWDAITLGSGTDATGTYTISGTVSRCDANGIILGENGGTGNLTIENGATFISGIDNSSSMIVGNAGSTGNLMLNGGTLQSYNFYVGYDGGNGTVTMSGGTLQLSKRNIWVGQKTGSKGLFTQTGGSVDLVTYNSGTGAARDLVLGGYGTGTYDMQGGTFLVDLVVVAEQGGTGILNISGNSEFTASEIRASCHADSDATVNLSGNAILNLELMVLGRNGTTIMNMSGGTVNIVNNFYLGGNAITTSSGANATLTQTGGSINLTDTNGQMDLVIGYIGTGAYNIQGGSFQGDWAIVGENNGSGTLNISGEADFTCNKITVGLGTGSGILNLSGGTLNTGTLNVDADGSEAFNFTGGTLSADLVSGIAVLQQGGVVSPGDSPGKSVFDAGYTMQAAGSYLVEINDVDQGDLDGNGYGYDWIDVIGTASLAGTVEIDLLEADLGDLAQFISNATSYTFDVLTADTIAIDEATFGLSSLDDLASLGFVWAYSVLGDAGSGQILQLQINAIPEPSTIILLLGLVIGMIVFRRH